MTNEFRRLAPAMTWIDVNVAPGTPLRAPLHGLADQRIPLEHLCGRREQRQAVRDLARHAEVILVVGAKNSSNSSRLREIASAAGVPSHLIADASELQAHRVRNARTVGITAGASAPEVLVQGVVTALRRLGPIDLSVLPGPEEIITFRMPTALA